jgi:hypothetical protein
MHQESELQETNNKNSLPNTETRRELIQKLNEKKEVKFKTAVTHDNDKENKK